MTMWHLISFRPRRSRLPKRDGGRGVQGGEVGLVYQRDASRPASGANNVFQIIDLEI